MEEQKSQGLETDQPDLGQEELIHNVWVYLAFLFILVKMALHTPIVWISCSSLFCISTSSWLTVAGNCSPLFTKISPSVFFFFLRYRFLQTKCIDLGPFSFQLCAIYSYTPAYVIVIIGLFFLFQRFSEKQSTLFWGNLLLVIIPFHNRRSCRYFSSSCFFTVSWRCAFSVWSHRCWQCSLGNVMKAVWKMNVKEGQR